MIGGGAHWQLLRCSKGLVSRLEWQGMSAPDGVELVSAPAVERRATAFNMVEDDDDAMEDVSRTTRQMGFGAPGYHRGGETQRFSMEEQDIDMNAEEDNQGWDQMDSGRVELLPRVRVYPTPPWQVPTMGSTGTGRSSTVSLLPRRDPDMGVRVTSLFDELSGAVQTPTLTLYPEREYRTSLALGGTMGPLDKLL